MIAVDIPQFDITSADFFRECVKTTRPKDKRGRLREAADDVESAVEEYIELADNQQLHEIESVEEKFSSANHKDFKSLYDSYLVNQKAAKRCNYDKILAAPTLDVCPFCATRNVATIDHFLPRSHFPQFCIAFENLVASCSDCNKAKGESRPTATTNLLYHPYYEAFPDQEWLLATIVHEQPVEVVFTVIETVPNYERLYCQFEDLRLNDIYAVRAATEISTMAYYFRQLLESDSLCDHLKSIATSAGCQKLNPWKQALYTALVDDDWFCDGGFIEA